MNLADLRLFIRIAETQSITHTAKQFDLTAPAVSAALKRLELQLNFPLFIRSTRQLRITPQGEQFLEYAQQALDVLSQGQIAAQQTVGQISGHLRLSVSSDLGRNVVLPWFDELLERYPDLTISLNVGDAISDLYQEQIEVALRYGQPAASNMVSFLIARIPRITCAASAYLNQYGTPNTPEQLKQHQCLLYRRDDQLFNQWRYQHQQTQYAVKVSGRRTCNDTDIVKRWAVAGKGIIYRSLLDVSQELEQGQLQPILSQYKSPPVELHLICPDRAQISPAVLMLKDVLKENVTALLQTHKNKALQ